MVEFARGHSSPVWPLPGVQRKRWSFGASRASGARRHAGVDLYAPRGSVVLAPEGGVVIAAQKFNGPRAHALLIQTDTGPVILLGEVEPGSWSKYGVSIGSRVERGQSVADIGVNPGGSQMLHYEMYRKGTRRNHRWMANSTPPAELLDPTKYLKTAVALDAAQDDDGEEIGDDLDQDEKDAADDSGDDQSDEASTGKDDVVIDPVKLPPQGKSGFFGSPIFLLGIVGLALAIDWNDR